MTQCLSWAKKNKKITAKLFLILAVVFLVLILPQITFAQSQLGLEYASASGLGTTPLKPLIFKIINTILGFLGIMAIIIILYGGFVWMTSAGNKDKIEKAKKILINGAIGLAIILASWSIASFLLWWLTGQGLIGGMGGPIGPGDQGGGSGALGSGIIESHYPGRNATGIARNTKIIITFKEPMQPDTLITAGKINSANVKISAKAEAGSGPYLSNITASVTPDNKTFIFDPTDLLGSASEDVWYRVQLTNSLLKASGKVALPNGYSWDFQVSTFSDNTPPQIVKIRPKENSTNPRNIIIQINFSEAIDPTSISNITVANAAGPVAGTFAISNQYQTIEFIPEQDCGINACGTIIYCLPEASDITVTVKAANGASLPQADFPYNGIVDMAGNSLDGNKNGAAEGQPADDYKWQFKTTNEIDATPPQILAVEPDFKAEGVKLINPVKILFDSPMLYRSLNSQNITLTGGVNYWISAEDGRFCQKTLKPCSEDANCAGTDDICSAEEITLATVNHDRFIIKTQYNINVRDVQDDKQNCYSPAIGEGCPCTEDFPTCCNGVCIDKQDCSDIVISKTDISNWTYDSASQSLAAPADLDVDLGSGEVYVVSWSQNVIYKCSSALTGCSVFFGALGQGAAGYSDDNLLLHPNAISVFKDGAALIVIDEAGSSRLMIVDKESKKISRKLHFTSGTVKAIATDYQGKIFFVTDNQRIYKYSQDLATKEAEINANTPLQSIAVDKDNNIYVTTQANKIIKYKNDLSGELASYGNGQAEESQTKDPQGIDIDNNGNIYVVEKTGQRAFKFSADLGNKEEVFGKFGLAGSDKEHLNNPTKISLSQNAFYIADYGNNRVVRIIKKQIITPTGTGNCGNGTCNSGECLSCPQDCLGQCCPDGNCQANPPISENSFSCPQDCPFTQIASCGNNICQPIKGETCANCLADCGCGSGKVCCGAACLNPSCGASIACDDNNACTNDTCLNSDSCQAGCKFEPKTVCQTGDGCCPVGCNKSTDDDCPLNCPNGACDASQGETCAVCPADCGCSNGKVCRDSGGMKCLDPVCVSDASCTGALPSCKIWQCQSPGTAAASCVQQDESPCCGNGACEPGECMAGCGADCSLANCLDGTCEPAIGENCQNAPVDCVCLSGYSCDSVTKTCLKNCSDGTEANKCSDNDKPKWCNGASGTLLNNQCGAMHHNCPCPIGFVCNPDGSGSCTDKCSDDTALSSCSTNTPGAYCDSTAHLTINQCTTHSCSCGAGICQADICITKCSDDTPLGSCSTATPGVYCDATAHLIVNQCQAPHNCSCAPLTCTADGSCAPHCDDVNETPFGSCSVFDLPKWCDGGTGHLIDNQCGAGHHNCSCPIGFVCNPDGSGSCTDKCSDNTLLGSCSADKPKWCNLATGTLIDNQCGATQHNCGCPGGTPGYTCETATGKCLKNCLDGATTVTANSCSAGKWCDGATGILSDNQCGPPHNCACQTGFSCNSTTGSWTCRQNCVVGATTVTADNCWTTNKPKWCDGAMGNIINKCSAPTCTCPTGTCQPDGSCRLSDTFIEDFNNTNYKDAVSTTALWNTATGKVSIFEMGVTIKQIVVGYRHTCALLNNGTVKCWGDNSYGQLGDGTTTQRLTPVQVSGLSDAVAISVGELHTCALLSDKTVKCWGHNSSGELGDGTTTQRLTPVFVSGLTNATAISAGQYHTCALLEDKTVKCWGSNSSGQLGDGTTTQRLTPVFVSGLTTATAISVGAYHTCALIEDKTVKCWGSNSNGQLGDGTTTQRLTPVSVSGITTATAISAGYLHACALLEDKTVKCWGNNGYGQLGTGNTTDYYTPQTVVTSLGGIALINAIAIITGNSFDSLHTCALLEDKTVKCWGSNFYGQLGNGSFSYSFLIPVQAQGITTATVISTGGNNVGARTCALLEDKTVKCWGYNDNGQLGDGTTTQRLTPVSVSGITTATAISTGTIYTCALLEDKTVKCWGFNSNGQLGDGTTTQRLTPVSVSGITTATAISAGYLHACALLSGKTVWCWGYNSNGKLGDGTTTQRLTPVQVSGLSDVVAISAGPRHTCALLEDKTVKCWGNNSNGQLGDGTGIQRLTPVQVSGLSDVVAISAGSYEIVSGSTCALLSDKTVKCWGANSYGQLGDGTTTQRSTPVSVQNISTAIAIAINTDSRHTCALLSDKTVKCWGFNSSGQLGVGFASPKITIPTQVGGGLGGSNSAIAQSTKINSTSSNILSARISVAQNLPTGTIIHYYLSNNGGATWEEPVLGVEWTFTSIGNNLRWKAVLETTDPTVTPEIDTINITYYY